MTPYEYDEYDGHDARQLRARRRSRVLRRWTTAGLALVTAAGLAACGSSSGATSSSSSSSGAGGSASSSAAPDNGPLQTITIALPSAAVTAFSANYSIGDYLGCYKQFGYKVNVIAVKTPAALVAAFHNGSVDVGVPGSDEFINEVNSIKNSGGGLDLKAFYEFDYPFRYGMGVKASSSVSTFADLNGKSVGIAAISDSSNPTLQAILEQQKLSPTSIKTIATGTGAASAQALDSGKVDGLWLNDVGMGAVIQDNVPLKFLPVNGKAPYINAGGILAVTTAADYQANPKKFQAVARCTTMGSIFAEANPTAAAYILLKMFPTLGLTGKSLTDQLKPLTFSLMLRAPLFHSTDKTVPYGQMDAAEFTNDQTILLKMDPKSLDMTPYWTNDLISGANDLDVAAIQKQAKDFQIPGVTLPLQLPTIPPYAP